MSIASREFLERFAFSTVRADNMRATSRARSVMLVNSVLGGGAYGGASGDCK